MEIPQLYSLINTQSNFMRNYLNLCIRSFYANLGINPAGLQVRVSGRIPAKIFFRNHKKNARKKSQGTIWKESSGKSQEEFLKSTDKFLKILWGNTRRKYWRILTESLEYIYRADPLEIPGKSPSRVPTKISGVISTNISLGITGGSWGG